MSVRLVALDDGPDISLDREMLVVGRHPQCDARLDSIRVSRRHCCMTSDNGEIVVKDLGSTNGIRINGQRVEKGRLRPGDELSIAHIRYRLDDGNGHEMTLAETGGERNGHANGNGPGAYHHPILNGNPPKDVGFRLRAATSTPANGEGEGEIPIHHGEENKLAAAVRGLLPAGMADKCRIQVIVQMPHEAAAPAPIAPAAEDVEECRPDLSP